MRADWISRLTRSTTQTSYARIFVPKGSNLKGWIKWGRWRSSTICTKKSSDRPSRDQPLCTITRVSSRHLRELPMITPTSAKNDKSSSMDERSLTPTESLSIRSDRQQISKNKPKQKQEETPKRPVRMTRLCMRWSMGCRVRRDLGWVSTAWSPSCHDKKTSEMWWCFRWWSLKIMTDDEWRMIKNKKKNPIWHKSRSFSSIKVRGWNHDKRWIRLLIWRALLEQDKEHQDYFLKIRSKPKISTIFSSISIMQSWSKRFQTTRHYRFWEQKRWMSDCILQILPEKWSKRQMTKKLLPLQQKKAIRILSIWDCWLADPKKLWRRWRRVLGCMGKNKKTKTMISNTKFFYFTEIRR